ncbi:MAG: MBL fold metallo-hydrolase [Candidatus Eisenbacteria bacterium]|nr:MBL fold metallo-hydrolase [Candidatus Eisenbacteria bacterium]
MKLTFRGTRGYIEGKSHRHRRHSVLEIAHRGTRVRIDWGADWRGRWDALPRPHALWITHAHPDHAAGLEAGAPCPVYATRAAWRTLRAFPISQPRTVRLRRERKVGAIGVEAFGLEHSVRAPAVGYRIRAGRATVFYAPDLVYIRQRRAALRDVDLYVGDGATLERSFVRKRGDALIGHAPVRTQLTWCRKEGVPRAMITHCGMQIVAGDERRLGARLRALGRERGVEVEIAGDGQQVVLR